MTAPACRAERGSVTGFVVVLVPALLACAGLAIDGGRLLAAHREAREAAEGAARAGAQELAVDAGLAGNPTALARGPAVGAGESYLRVGGHRGTVTVTAEGTVRVEVNVTVEFMLLGLIGVHERTTVAVGEAVPVFGITGEEP